MHQQLTKEHCEKLFGIYRGWFGPPAVRYCNTYIDGRTRVAQFSARLRGQPFACLVVHNDSEAARALVLAHHYERAKAYIPEALHNVSDAAAFCGLEREDVAPMFATGRPKRLAAHTTPRRRQAIERISRLLREAEQGSGTVSAARIREVLSPWL